MHILFAASLQSTLQVTELYSEPCLTSKMESFAKIVNGLQLLTILEKISILNAGQGSEYASLVSEQ